MTMTCRFLWSNGTDHAAAPPPAPVQIGSGHWLARFVSRPGICAGVRLPRRSILREEGGIILIAITAQTDTGRCLRYEQTLPGYLTAITLSVVAGLFALDSNTFNAPPPPPATREGDAYRHLLKNRLDELEQQRLQLLKPPPASALTCPTKLNNSMTCVPI